jgi:hypothetical protein
VDLQAEVLVEAQVAVVVVLATEDKTLRFQVRYTEFKQ